MPYLNDLSKGSLPNHLSDFIAVGYVVMQYLDVATVLIIIAWERRVRKRGRRGVGEEEEG